MKIVRELNGADYEIIMDGLANLVNQQKVAIEHCKNSSYFKENTTILQQKTDKLKEIEYTFDKVVQLQSIHMKNKYK